MSLLAGSGPGYAAAISSRALPQPRRWGDPYLGEGAVYVPPVAVAQSKIAALESGSILLDDTHDGFDVYDSEDEEVNVFGYYVGATQRRQDTVERLVDPGDRDVSFGDYTDVQLCKWVPTTSLSFNMEWHPLWNKYEFGKRVASGNFYGFQKSPGLEEPIVFTFLEREPVAGFPALKMDVLGLHRPGVTFKSIIADGVKFAGKEPVIDAHAPHWQSALDALRLLFDNFGLRSRLATINEILDASDPSTSPGFPSNLTVGDKGGAMRTLSETYLRQYLTGRGCCTTSFFCCFVRTQVQSRMKEKNRVILATDSYDQFALMHIMLKFMQRFVELVYAPDWPFTVGDSVFNGGPHAQISKLYGNDGIARLGDGSDISGWDGSLPGIVIKMAAYVAFEYVEFVGLLDGYPSSSLKTVYYKLIDSIIHGHCLFPWGEVLITEKGMKSGTFVTALFNSIAHYLIRAAAFFERYDQLTPSERAKLNNEYGHVDRFKLWRLVRMSISGDDNRTATPVLMRSIWSPSVYADFYRRIGMSVKDSSTQDHHVIRDLWMLPYNSRIYPVVEGKHVVYRPAHVLWASVAYPERESRGSLSGPAHHSRLLARCTATYLEGFMNIHFREAIELFVAKVIPPHTIIDWDHERGFKKRLTRLGVKGEFPMSFPGRQFAWRLHLPMSTTEGPDFPGVPGSENYPGTYDHLF